MNVLELAVGQTLALVTFFAFPAGQYVLLRMFSKREGLPELWYLPDHGFRLVIRNLPRRRTLTDVRYRSFIRGAIPRSRGSSVATTSDLPLLSGDDMVLFPGTDLILLGFRLRRDQHGRLLLIPQGRSDGQRPVVPIQPHSRLVADYSATIQNFFNFNVQLAKRVEISGSSLAEFCAYLQHDGRERRLPVDLVRNVR